MSTDHEEVTYWEGWHRHAREAVGPLDSSQAKDLDDAGEPYLVLLGDPLQPRCFIEVNRDFFGVSFLDKQKREHLMYTFEELEPHRLFLSEAVKRQFNHLSDAVTRGVVYRFTPGGNASIERIEGRLNQATATDLSIDISRNWEPWPTFGDYSSITCEER